MLNQFNSAAKSKTLIAPVETSNGHRVSFLSAIHGYVAGRRWYSVYGIIYIQSTRSGKWIPYSNQYKTAVEEALASVTKTSPKVSSLRRPDGVRVYFCTAHTQRPLGSIEMTCKEYLDLMSRIHNGSLMGDLPHDLTAPTY